MDILNSTLDDAIGRSKILLFMLGALSIVFVVAKWLLHVDYDPREPPIIPHPIPYVGHIIGMFRHGAAYFDKIKCVSASSFTTLCVKPLVCSSF